MKYCAKASDAQAERAWASGEWIGQEKKDGALYQLEKTDEGNLYLFSRTTSKKTGELAEKLDNFPQIRSFGERLPNGTILIGEVYVPGGKSNTVTKLSGCLPEKAIKRQFKKEEADEFISPAHYYLFDIIRYAGEDIIEYPTIKRLEYLNKVSFIIQESENAMCGPAFIEIAPVFYDNFEEHLKNIFAAGGEGMVFKHKDCPYRPGKRTTMNQMFKWKEHLDSIDLVCMELLDPVKEYTGKELDTWPYWELWEEVAEDKWQWVKVNYCHKTPDRWAIPVTKPYFYDWYNAMRLGAYKDGKLVEVGRVASGLTDELREDMATHPEDYLNKVIEVECMSITKDGALRHPVFKRVREDKSPSDCLWDEIFGGLNAS